MNRTIVCKLLGSIHEFIENSDAKELEKATIGKKLLYISDDIANTFLIDNHNAPSGLVHKTEPTVVSDTVADVPDLPPTEDDIEMVEEVDEPSFEEQLETAYDILKVESRPGPTLVERTMGIKKALANKLWKELLGTGRIVKGQRAVDNEETTDELSEGFSSVEESSDETSTPSTSLIDLINDLPVGNNLLVQDHLKHLIVLPEANRAVYLSGLKLEEVVSVESVEEASLDGADTTLVDEIVANSGFKPAPVKARLNLGNKDNEQMVKYSRLRGVWVKGIPNGKALYDVMARNGVNKRVLGDLRTIYQSVESGDV